MLAAGASVLQVAESLFPHPLPGVRLGLANIITVIALTRLGPSKAVRLAVLRTLVSSMLLGTFLTPSFVLSFFGAVVSALVMVGLYQFSGRGRLSFSLLGVSVGGAVSHMLAQVLLVYLLFIRSPGVLWLWPWLVITAVLAGGLTGLVALQALRRLRSARLPMPARAESDPSDESHRPEPCPAGTRVTPEAKLAATSALSLVVVVFSDWRLYAGVFGLLVFSAALARVSAARVARRLRLFWPLPAAALLLPLVFSNWGRVWLELGPVRVTDQGLGQGSLFAARLLLLFLATSILSETTKPHQLARGLQRLLRPLRIFGLNFEGLARSLTLSWTYFPQLWENVKQMARAPSQHQGWVSRVLNLPGETVAGLFLLVEQRAATAQDMKP